MGFNLHGLMSIPHVLTNNLLWLVEKEKWNTPCIINVM